MGERPKLAIDGITDKEFSTLKSEHLDQRVLSDEALTQIRDLFGVGTPATGYINCDEFHAHSYKCVSFANPVTGVVDRLLQEIDRYKSKFEKAKDYFSE